MSFDETSFASNSAKIWRRYPPCPPGSAGSDIHTKERDLAAARTYNKEQNM